MVASILEMLAVGLVSGLISPCILSVLQHKYIWKRQRNMEMKQRIFDDAVKALSLYVVDALDMKLQGEKQSYKGSTRRVERRPETWQLIEETRAMVRAFFSEDTHKKLEDALKADVSLENVPHIEFEQKRVAAIQALCGELGLT